MRYIYPSVRVMLLATLIPAHAGEVDGQAVLGGALGGATGAAVGAALGGREGAIVGAGVGGALGTAVATHESDPQPRAVSKEVVHIQEVHHYSKRHDHGLHRGHHKRKHKHR